MTLKVKYIAFTATRGGAAKAMFRQALIVNKNNLCVEIINMESPLSVNNIDDINITSPNRFLFAINFIKRCLSFFLLKLMKTKNNSKHSLNLFSNRFIKNKISDGDIVHIHWINNETLSIKDIYDISVRSKCFMTLHDEWTYLGCQHYRENNKEEKMFFSKKNNIEYKFKSIIDLNWFNFKRKKKYLTCANLTYIVPSQWMAEQAKNSILLRNARIEVIPNVINFDVFRRTVKKETDKFKICFGAINGNKSPIKGFDLLVKALNIISKENTNHNIELFIFGSNYTYIKELEKFNCTWLNHITDENELAKIYSSCHITVVPSRIESFGQVAAESIACGTPVVCFDTSGLKDIVIHKENGYLAEPFNIRSLSNGILYFYNLNTTNYEEISLACPQTIYSKFNSDIVGNKLITLYRENSND
ncbi:glycosyltransferase [Providencia sp. PROV201]|uniref:glycosyltransferase n=1 Tax=Providencia sp. PROV201 TaxID=2949901 RepID=UPI0023495335|nr:glycosyltransferase [Providencia sp. PROV201]